MIFPKVGEDRVGGLAYTKGDPNRVFHIYPCKLYDKDRKAFYVHKDGRFNYSCPYYGILNDQQVRGLSMNEIAIPPAQVDTSKNELQTQIDTLKKGQAELQRQIDTLKNEKTELQTQVGTLTNEKTELQTQVRTLTNEKTELQTQVRTLTNEKTELQTQVRTLTNEKTELQTQVGTLTNDKTELQAQADKDKTGLQAQVDTLKSDNAELRAELKKWKPKRPDPDPIDEDNLRPNRYVTEKVDILCGESRAGEIFGEESQTESSHLSVHSVYRCRAVSGWVRKQCYGHRFLGTPASWRCGLGTQVVFLYLATPSFSFFSSFFRFAVLVTIYLYDSF